MPEFKYVAKDKSGKTVKGTIEAQDQKGAIALLRRKELVIVLIEEARKAFKFSFRGGIGRLNIFVKKANLDDLTIFSRQLATMLDAGIPVVNALDVLAEQIEKPLFKQIVVRVRNDVEAGASLSDALGRNKEVFSTFFVNMTKAGEASGTLDEILDRVATYIEKTNNLRKKIRAAMIYPAVVTGMALIITLFLLIRVIPVFKEIYAGFGAALPLPTQILISISDFLSKYFLFAVAGFIAIGFFINRYARTDKGRLRLDEFKLKVPVFGTIIRKVVISNFTRTLSTLVKSGVPILNSLDIVSKTSGNRVLELAVNNVKDSVRDGERIAGPLNKSKIFPPIVARMVAVGEESGELEKMLSKIADFYDTQIETAISGLTSLIEPFIIAFLGIVIGTIVVCMFLPIFRITEIIGV